MEVQEQPQLPRAQAAMRVLSGWVARAGLLPLGRVLWRWEMKVFPRDLYTGLLHRMSWMREYDRLSPRDGGLLLVDVDYMKRVNDQLWYIEGDRALWRLARVVEREAPGCLVGRHGGDELLVYVPAHTDTLAVAERIRTAVEAEPLLVEMRSRMPPEAPTTVLTVSVAAAPVAGRPLELVFHDLDEACCEAKNQGRNRVVVRASH